MLGVDLTAPPQVVAQGRSVHGRDRTVEEFELPDLWSLHLYQYAADLDVDGRSHPITPGSLSLVRPATPVRYRYRGPSPHLYAHLRAPVLDADGPRALVVTAGPNLPVFTDLMSSAVTSAAAFPERTRADVWMVLLRLRDAVRPQPGAPGLAENYVATTMSYVEAHLADSITVPEIARSVGVSPDHLTRVFSRTTGQTIAGYVRRRRVERAVHLLTRTTMSVSAVAAAVGIPDLQAFNKTCRAVTGRSPRRLREQG